MKSEVSMIILPEKRKKRREGREDGGRREEGAKVSSNRSTLKGVGP